MNISAIAAIDTGAAPTLHKMNANGQYLKADGTVTRNDDEKEDMDMSSITDLHNYQAQFTKFTGLATLKSNLLKAWKDLVTSLARNFG